MDKIWDYYELGHAFTSRAPTVFYFSTQNYFTISLKFLDFLRSLDRFKVLITVIISEFYMACREKLTKIFIYLRGWRKQNKNFIFEISKIKSSFSSIILHSRLQISVISAMFPFYIWIIEKVEKRIWKAVKGLQFKILICRMNT